MELFGHIKMYLSEESKGFNNRAGQEIRLFLAPKIHYSLHKNSFVSLG